MTVLTLNLSNLMENMSLGRCLLIILLLAYSEAFSIEEVNTVIVPLHMELGEFQSNSSYKSTLFEIIAEITTKNCTIMRMNCQLIPKYSRSGGNYERNITVADFKFTANLISELKPAESGQDSNYTELRINLMTFTTYDFLKWTDLVRIINYYIPYINDEFNSSFAIQNVMSREDPPKSYVAQLIDNDKITPAIISGVLVTAALALFAILTPLSQTKYCRKSSDKLEDSDTTALEAEEKK